jgi:excisionase family DNA binding protein
MNTTQNPPSPETITVSFTGQLVLSRAILQELIRPVPTLAPQPTPQPVPKAGAFERAAEEGKLPRLAYSMQETAEILGLSYITVFRLVQRGLLRSVSATRHKLIPRKEIERFLATATPAG